MEIAPNVYELSSNENSQYAFLDDQSEASTPAADYDTPRPSASPLATVHTNPAYTTSAEEHPTPVNNASDPPVYAAVNRLSKSVVSDATDDDGKQPSTSPPTSSYDDLTLVENDLYE